MQSRSRLWNYHTLRNIIASSCHALGWPFSWLTPNLGQTSHGRMVSSSPMQSWRWVCHSHLRYLCLFGRWLNCALFSKSHILRQSEFCQTTLTATWTCWFCANRNKICRPHRPQELLSIQCCLQFYLQHLLLRRRDIKIYQQLFPHSALCADIIFSAIHIFSSEFSVISLIFAFNINFLHFSDENNSVRWYAMSARISANV